MNNKNIDGYIIPKNDQFFSEYSFPNRLKLISNFSGSAGLAIILKNKNFLFVDGRYTLQANIECGKSFKIFEIPKIRPFDVLKKIKNKLTLGFDPKLFTEFSLKSNFKDTCNLIPINNNLIDEIFNLKNNYKIREFYCLNEVVVGEKITSKLKKLTSILKKRKIQNIFISAPENCAWLLNIRGFDNPNSPIPNCQIVINNKNIYFFSDIKKIKKIKNKINYKKIKFYEFKEFLNVLRSRFKFSVLYGLAAALLGAALMILADLVARIMITPAEIPVSLVTSALGAPFFLWLIARSRPI